MPTAPLDSTPTHTLAPVPGVVLPLKTLDDWRAIFHQAVPIIVTALVSAHLVTNDQVTLWVSLAFAIVDPLLSIGNTTDKVRKIIYGLLALGQSAAAVTTVVQVVADHSSPVVAPFITLGGSIISGILGNMFTPTPSTIMAVSGSFAAD